MPVPGRAVRTTVVWHTMQEALARCPVAVSPGRRHVVRPSASSLREYASGRRSTGLDDVFVTAVANVRNALDKRLERAMCREEVCLWPLVIEALPGGGVPLAPHSRSVGSVGGSLR